MFALKKILIFILRNTIISLIAIFIATATIIFLSHKIENVSESVNLNRRLEVAVGKRSEITQVINNDAIIIGTNDAAIENAFVPSDNILGFISALDGLAQRKSLTETYRFESPIISTISAPFPISTILYSNNLVANIVAFSDYLKDFEKLPYFTKIDSLSIASQDKQGWLGASTVTIHATLFTKGTQ